MDPEIFHPDKHIALSASAGSGKTYALVLRLLTLLLLGEPLDKIVALTFTNMAADEMKIRILDRLRQLVFQEVMHEEDRTDLEKMVAMLLDKKEPEKEDYQWLKKRASTVYHEVLANFSSLEIGTLDSFCASIIRLFPFEVGVNPDFKISTAASDNVIFHEALDRMLSLAMKNESLKDQLLSLYDMSGSKAFDIRQFLERYIRILVEKRSELVSFQQLSKGIDPIMKDKETIEGEIKESIEHLLTYLTPVYSQFEESERKEYEKLLSVGEAGNYLALMDCTSLKNVYSSKRKIFWFPALSAAGCVEEVHAILSSIRKSVEILVERVNRHFVLILFDLYCMFLNVYDDLRNERGCLAFRDLERLSLVLMTQEMCEDRSDYFYYRLDRRIKHLFIDEFQDTSVIQWKVLEPIVAELTAGLGTGESPGSFFYVGDKKQAIFRFRRGESYLFDWVKDVFPEKITEKLLDVNYRSAGAIVSFVNQIFTYISKEKGYHYNSQVPYRAEEDGYIEILAVVDEEGQNTLFTLVSKKITELYDHGYSYNDIAILVRKNDTAERITRHLAQVGIPYISESKVKLFETESIRSCYHLLQYLNELHEEIYLVNFLVSQVGGYHGERLRELLRKKTLKPILKCIDGNVRIKIEKLLDMVDIVSLPHLIQSIYTLFGFFDVYGDSHNLLKFLDIAHEYSKEYPQGLFSFLEYIKQEGNEISQAKEALRDGVQVMTVHKAKGLEFEAVILPEITFDLSFNKNKGLLLFTYHDDTLLLDEVYITPTEKERSYSDTLTRAFLYEAKRVESDELNNLYVGLTRAKKALFLVGELKKRKYTHTWFNLILSSLNIGIDIDKIRAQGSMIIHTEGYLTRKTQIKSVTPCTSLRRVYTTPLLDNLKPKVKGREAIEEKEAFESFDEESFRKRLFGKALHHTLLHIGLISEGEMERVIDRALMFTNHKYGFLFGEDDLTCIRDRINDLLACSKLRPFFFQRDGIDIYNEWEVISRHSGYYRLRIPDRIIVDTQKVTVIDYKTHYSDVTFVHYKMQLREYKQILRSIFAGKIIEGILVYLQREGIKFFEV